MNFTDIWGGLWTSHLILSTGTAETCSTSTISPARLGGWRKWWKKWFQVDQSEEAPHSLLTFTSKEIIGWISKFMFVSSVFLYYKGKLKSFSCWTNKASGTKLHSQPSILVWLCIMCTVHNQSGWVVGGHHLKDLCLSESFWQNSWFCFGPSLYSFVLNSLSVMDQWFRCHGQNHYWALLFIFFSNVFLLFNILLLMLDVIAAGG